MNQASHVQSGDSRHPDQSPFRRLGTPCSLAHLARDEEVVGSSSTLPTHTLRRVGMHLFIVRLVGDEEVTESYSCHRHPSA